jgi:hypothetical protein
LPDDSTADAESGLNPANPRFLKGPPTEAERREEERQRKDEERHSEDVAFKHRQLGIAEHQNTLTGKQNTINERLVIYTLLLVALGAIGNGVAWYAARVARISADAAKSAAETAASTRTDMQTGGVETKTQIDRLITQQQRTADSMEKSLTAGKKALDASIAASRNDQRAWLGLSSATLLEEYDPAKGMLVRFSFKNSGRTPAHRANLSQWSYGIHHIADLEPVSDTVQGTYKVVPPGELMTFEMGVRAAPEITRALANGGRIFLRGIVEYLDIFDATQETEFCVWYPPPPTSRVRLLACNEGNSMTSPREPSPKQ